MRLNVPWKYGYKRPQCVTAITFVERTAAGHWPSVGPYTTAGDKVGYDVL
jgi:DMSO/TMAO reductase YedYZ molybdopterin-dependent catalytic subunit